MSRASAFALPLIFLLAPAPGRAEIGVLDNVPAATLLLPYFEVDLDDPIGRSTLFSVSNAFEGPVIAHVTLWTDLSVPTLDFNMYLTGYEDPSVNLRDTFVSGRPGGRSATVDEHFSKGLVPPDCDPTSGSQCSTGPFSLTLNPLTGVGPQSAGCQEQLPLPDLPAILLEHIRSAHTGKPSVVFGGLCAGIDHGDNVARGYITIDSVSSCSLDFPGDTGYFIAGGAGTANNGNFLWGDYFYVNDTESFAYGETLVHLEASAELGPGNYTFYRRYSGGADQREGLAASFATRYVAGGAFTGGTDLLVWRDSKRVVAPFNCALGMPQPFPLSQNQVVIFDEQENPDVPTSSPFSPAIPGASLLPFPWESQRTRMGGDDFPVPFAFGWLYLNLNSAVAGSLVPFEPLLASFVSAAMNAGGRFSAGYDAIQLDNVTRPDGVGDLTLPVCDGEPDPAGCS